MVGTCFVIQPFDSGKYDERYEDTFAPAIREAGLEPYRVDRDRSVSVPIDQIESGIRQATVCFAEITEDNPNVWYDLRFVFSANKPVVMVCSEERGGKFPFDISHRRIIKYRPTSQPQFEKLKKEIIATPERAVGNACSQPSGIRDSVPPRVAQQWRLFGRFRMG